MQQIVSVEMLPFPPDSSINSQCTGSAAAFFIMFVHFQIVNVSSYDGLYRLLVGTGFGVLKLGLIS